MEKVNIPLAAEGLSAYAAQRLAGFEQHRLGDTYRQPETRHKWIRDILRGMAEVCGQDAAPLLQSFERRLTDAHSASAVGGAFPRGQKHMIRSLDRYGLRAGCMEGLDQRSQFFMRRSFWRRSAPICPGTRTPTVPGPPGTGRGSSSSGGGPTPHPLHPHPAGDELDPGGVEFLPGDGQRRGVCAAHSGIPAAPPLNTIRSGRSGLRCASSAWAADGGGCRYHRRDGLDMAVIARTGRLL